MAGEMIRFLESEILKGKHFPVGSRDRLRATLVNLFILVGSFVILLYAYENMVQGYYGILAVEMVMVLVLVIGYLVFPYYTNIEQISYMILGALTFLLAISLVLPDKDPELSIFWLASLPIFVFYFLGVRKGIVWNGYMFVILLIVPLISFVADVKFVYTWELLSQIIVGFLIVSYMLYIIEKERSSYEQRLNVALKENTMLFKEVHHRTKNNMQVIMGLLESQSFKIDEPKYRKMFEAHINRLKAMSLMHKNLYSEQNFEQVDIKKYLREVISSLQLYTEHKIESDIDEIMIDMKDAMNIGLIVNEAVTNSIEHAFGGDNEGNIDISLKHIGHRCSLAIKDNGRGFDTEKTYKSLGVTLIRDLSSTLHNSAIVLSGISGTSITIYFDLKEY
ncbi:MAG: sensor histidine kinase [Sulfurovum sp.]|nr:sensor histidine kinase [Sulfurovum sp.]